MSRGMHCENCGKSLHQSEVAAEVWQGRAAHNGGEVRKVWCMPCWDASDENALNQYRNAGAALGPEAPR